MEFMSSKQSEVRVSPLPIVGCGGTKVKVQVEWGNNCFIRRPRQQGLVPGSQLFLLRMQLWYSSNQHCPATTRVFGHAEKERVEGGGGGGVTNKILEPSR